MQSFRINREENKEAHQELVQQIELPRDPKIVFEEKTNSTSTEI